MDNKVTNTDIRRAFNILSLATKEQLKEVKKLWEYEFPFLDQFANKVWAKRRIEAVEYYLNKIEE